MNSTTSVLDSKASDAILTSVVTNGTIAVIIFSVVALLMLLWPDFYTPRMTGAPLMGDKTPPPRFRGALLLCGGFLYQLCALPASQVRAQAGYDGYMLYRITQLAFTAFSVFTVFALLLLVPVSYTADDEQQDPVTRSGMQNVPNGSDRLWVFTIAVFFVTLLMCFMIYKLAVEYAQLRRSYLRGVMMQGAEESRAALQDGTHQEDGADAPLKPLPSPTASVDGGDFQFTTHVNLALAAQGAVRGFGDDGSTAWPRTVMALDVPPHVRNSSQLLEMFSALYPGEVQSALLVVGTAEVDGLKAQREQLAFWYETARWQHRERSDTKARTVFARRCFVIAIVCNALGCTPVHVEDPAFLEDQPDVAAAEIEKADKAEEKAAAKKGKRVPATPANAAEHIHNNKESQAGDPAGTGDAFSEDADFFGDDTTLRGAYCCCCLPCGSCKRGRGCHCLVANKACCGSVQPALPRLRNELLRVNALLGEKRITWWRTAKAQEVAERGVQPVEVEELTPEQEKKLKKHGPKPQKGGTGFITFRTARQAVTAANSYHVPNAAFDVPTKNTAANSGPSSVAPLPPALTGPAAKKRSAVAVAVEALTGNQRMTVLSAPRPADVNYPACTKTTKEQKAAQRIVFLLRTALLVIYSLLAIAVAAGGGEGSDEEGDNILITLYNGLGQSFLLTVLLALLPTILGIFAKLSHFKITNESRHFMIANLFFFKGWVGIVMIILGASLQATLSRLAEEPFSIIEVLGNDLPKFASFYVSFILLKALADLPRVLLQVGGLVQFAVRFGQGPNVKAMYRAMRGKGVKGGSAPATGDEVESPTAEESTNAAQPGGGEAPMLEHASSSASMSAGNPTATSTSNVPESASVPTLREDLMATARKFNVSPRQFVRLVVDGGGSFNYPAAISDVLFVLLIGFIFGAMVPILPPLIALTMAVMGMVYKYQLVYRTQRAPDSGAAFTPAILNRLAFALGLMQAVVAAMLFVREGPVAGAVTLIPLIATRVFIGTVNTRILSTADLLSLREAVEGDAAHGRMGPPPAHPTTPPVGVASSGAAGAGEAAPATAGSEDDAPASDRDASIVAAFVGEVLATHAYVPGAVMPTRDLQPGVVVLPPTVQLPADDEDDEEQDAVGDEEGSDEAPPAPPSTAAAVAAPADVHPQQRSAAGEV